MNVLLQIEVCGKCVVIFFLGWIVVDEIVGLVDEFFVIVFQGVVYFVFCFDELIYCNSFGFNFFICCFICICNVGGDVVLMGMQFGVRKLFELFKLD